MDGNVASLTGCTTRWLYRKISDNEGIIYFGYARCIITVEFGRACRWPFSPRRRVRSQGGGDTQFHIPAANNKLPMEHACPMQYVCIGEVTY